MNVYGVHCIECGATLYRATPDSAPCEFCGQGTMTPREGDNGPDPEAQTGDALTEADKAELADLWQKRRPDRPPVRMRCEYCGRILYRPDVKSFRCTSCFHGTMSEQKPNALCCSCGGPIFANVNSDHEVECWLCVAKKVEGVQAEELTRQMEFGSTRDWNWHVLKQDGRLTLAERLRKARKEMGWTQTLLAGRLGVSKRSVVKMENGDMKLPKRALTLIEKGTLPTIAESMLYEDSGENLEKTGPSVHR